MATWRDYFSLRQAATPPPPDTHESTVRFYADADGALRSLQSDGTDAAVGGGGGSQPVRWVGPYPFTYADFQPAFQTILGDAPAGDLLVGAAVFVDEAWNDTGDRVSIKVYVADPDNESFAIDNLEDVTIKVNPASNTDAQGNVSGFGSICIPGNGIVVVDGNGPVAPVYMQTPILIGDGANNKLILYFANGNNDGTTGAGRIYLSFATPVAP